MYVAHKTNTKNTQREHKENTKRAQSAHNENTKRAQRARKESTKRAQPEHKRDTKSTHTKKTQNGMTDYVTFDKANSSYPPVFEPVRNEILR